MSTSIITGKTKKIVPCRVEAAICSQLEKLLLQATIEPSHQGEQKFSGSVYGLPGNSSIGSCEDCGRDEDK